MFGDNIMKYSEMLGPLNDVLKKRMKRLAKLRVSYKNVRLRNDWEGY